MIRFAISSWAPGLPIQWQAHPGEDLQEHLLRVAMRAKMYLSCLPQNVQDEIFACGLLHDLGKACLEFLLGRIWKDLLPEQKAQLEPMMLDYVLDHSRPGSIVSYFEYLASQGETGLIPESERVRQGLSRMLYIDSHHVMSIRKTYALEFVASILMLSDDVSFKVGSDGRPKRRIDRKGRPLGIGESLARIVSSKEGFLSGHKALADMMLSWMQESGLTIPRHSGPPFFNPCCTKEEAIGQMLQFRIMYGALTDADRVETNRQEKEMSSSLPQRLPTAGDDGRTLNAEEDLGILLRYIDGLVNEKKGKVRKEIVEARDALLQACIAKGSVLPLGNYMVTAPTGIGKTLATLAFALCLAKNHGLKRIIISVPFLNILSQSASEIKEIFASKGDGYVMENHSLAAENEQSGNRNFARTWNAAIVITTNVQLLESLFSAHPEKVRKLHRLLESVVIFDEVQSFPHSLLIPTLAALSHLVDGLKKTAIVTSTATPPHFEMLSPMLKEFGAKWEPIEIAPALIVPKRYETTYKGVMSKETLIQELAPRRQVMCIVNKKRHAVALYLELLWRRKGEVFYLSTNLPPMDRENVLAEVRARLDKREPVILVATQVIDAGVDIDFPVVYRAMSPFTSLVQAPGRCNRNGMLVGPNGGFALGEFVIFDVCPNWDDDPYPDDDYRTGANISKHIIGSCPDVLNPSSVRKYFEELYGVLDPSRNARHRRVMFGRETGSEFLKISGGGIFKKEHDQSSRPNTPHMDFVEVANDYKVIEKDREVNIIVPCDETFKQKVTIGMTGVTEPWIDKAKRMSVARTMPQKGSELHKVIKPLRVVNDDGELEDSSDWFYYDETVDPYDRALGVRQPGWTK